MVFLISIRKSGLLAVQQLAELSLPSGRPRDSLATAEDLSVEELEELHEQYRHRAERRSVITHRRGDRRAG